MCKGMFDSTGFMSRRSRTFGNNNMLRIEDISCNHFLMGDITSTNISENMIMMATRGPATEALERSFKRRFSHHHPHDRLHTEDEEPIEDDSPRKKTKITSELDEISSASVEGSSSSSSDLAFNLDDAFNAISSVENEDYCDFPKIAWEFDDE
jgi:hypothetical protein